MDEKPKRRWFRFSLRSMFIVVTVSGFWFGWQLKIVRERRAVLAKINSICDGNFRYVSLAPSDAYPVSFPPGSYENARVPYIRGLFGDETCVFLELPRAMDSEWIERAENAFPEAQLMIRFVPGGAILALRDSLFCPPNERQANIGTIFKTGLIEK